MSRRVVIGFLCAGSYSSRDGSTHCLPCSQGSYALTDGSVNCTACSPGTNCRSVT